MRLAPALFLLLVITGCGPATRSDVDLAGRPLPKPTSTEEWTSVPSKDYESWKPHPVGTRLVRTNVTTIGNNSTTSVETWTLMSNTAGYVEVENQNTTTRSDGSYRKVNEPRVFKYPATLKVHPELNAEQFTKPDAKAIATGEEKLTVLGKEYACTIFEWTNSTEAGEMMVKAWISPAMPAQVVKQVMTVAKLNSTTIDQVTELSVAKAK
jgi:hypothetical protein